MSFHCCCRCLRHVLKLEARRGSQEDRGEALLEDEAENVNEDGEAEEFEYEK